MPVATLPVWLQIFIALATLFVSGFVAYTARAQVRIARERLALDLFDKRYEKYQAFRGATGEVERDGERSYATWAKFTRASYDMEYVFGEDVARHLEKIRDVGLRKRRGQQKLDRMDLPEGHPQRDQAISNIERDANHYDQLLKDLYPLLLQYMRMDHKRPQTFSEWLRDRWENHPNGK